MFKSLLCADKILNKFPCVVSYADIVYDYSAIKLLIKAKSDIAICYYAKWLTLWKKDLLIHFQTLKFLSYQKKLFKRNWNKTKKSKRN